MTADGLTAQVFLWRLDRADGVTLGFTSHDRDLTVDDFRYRSAPGFKPSRLALSDGFEPDNIELEGVLSDPAIAASDLAAGRWDGARLSISRIDWTAPDQQPETLIVGELGETVREVDSFRVEIIGPTAKLQRPVAPATSATCRAELGDRACQVALHSHRKIMALSAVEPDGKLRFDDLSGTADLYRWGRLRWLDGQGCGLLSYIVDGQGDLVTLADPLPFAATVGDRALLTEGCDKLFATCRDRFANAINFQGEPYLPGNDLLTRYPGGR